MSPAMTAVPVTPSENPLRALARSLALVGAVAFVIGFLAYVAMGQPVATAPAASAAAVSADASLVSPASDDWNLPKHI